MVILVTPALEGLLPQWREAAENLGASAWAYWRHVALPVLAPALVGPRCAVRQRLRGLRHRAGADQRFDPAAAHGHRVGAVGQRPRRPAERRARARLRHGDRDRRRDGRYLFCSAARPAGPHDGRRAAALAGRGPHPRRDLLPSSAALGGRVQPADPRRRVRRSQLPGDRPRPGADRGAAHSAADRGGHGRARAGAGRADGRVGAAAASRAAPGCWRARRSCRSSSRPS